MRGDVIFVSKLSYMERSSVERNFVQGVRWSPPSLISFLWLPGQLAMDSRGAANVQLVHLNFEGVGAHFGEEKFLSLPFEWQEGNGHHAIPLGFEMKLCPCRLMAGGVATSHPPG